MQSVSTISTHVPSAQVQRELSNVLSSGSTVVAVAKLVFLAALPILFPLIPPLIEIAIRVALSPLALLHTVVALNYTLFKHTPPDFLITALKANFFCIKGFIFGQFLPYATSSRENFRCFEDISKCAYAKMYLYALKGNENWSEDLEQYVARVPIDIPCFLESSFDLISYNQLRLQLDFFAPPPVAALEPKFAPFHIERLHLQRGISNVEIPNLPNGTNIATLFDQFWSHIDASWSEDVRINDDNQMRSKAYVIQDIKNYLQYLEDLFVRNTRNDHSSNITARAALGQVMLHFMARKRAIDAMNESAEKNRALQQWRQDGRSFVLSLAATCHHCIDRKLCDALIFYQRYVERKPITLDSLDNQTVETQVLSMLREHRQEIVQHACTNCIETDMHHAATERYVKSELNGELGLGMPPCIGGPDALTTYAIRNKVNEVRELFNRWYTPQSIVRDFQQRTRKLIAEDPNQKLYMKIIEWFERQDPPRPAEEVFDQDTLSFKEDAIIELLTKIGIIYREERNL
jgi:hypothetical protein